jgi:hypothetical protein
MIVRRENKNLGKIRKGQIRKRDRRKDRQRRKCGDRRIIKE